MGAAFWRGGQCGTARLMVGCVPRLRAPRAEADFTVPLARGVRSLGIATRALFDAMAQYDAEKKNWAQLAHVQRVTEVVAAAKPPQIS